jgi:nicotinamidase-related amidase
MAGAWTTPDEMLGSDLGDVLDACVAVLASARAADVPVYFTTMAYDQDMREPGTVALRKTPHLRRMVRGTEQVALVPELQRRESEPLIEKPRASGFVGTNLRAMLQSDGVDTIVVVGCSTSGCIRATAESGFNENLHVIIPREAVGDRSPTAHAASLFDIDQRMGDVESLADVLAHLDALAVRS